MSRAGTTRGWFGLDPAFGYRGNRGTRSDGREIALPAPDLFGAEMDDFDYAPFAQKGGAGKAFQVFGERLGPLLTELNEVLAA